MSGSYSQLIITVVALICTVLLFEYSDIDYVIQSYFYNFSTREWLLDSNNATLDLLFYSGIKKVFIGSILFLLFALIFLRRFDWVKNNTRGLVIVVLSSFAVPLTVGALKGATNMPCPNQLLIFNGKYEHVGLFEILPDQTSRPATRCYPAGHASGGFALLSLLFLFKSKKAKIKAFVSAMFLGWSTGGYKVLIGDHFFGHTMITMLIAWLIVLLISILVDKVSGYIFNKNIRI